MLAVKKGIKCEEMKRKEKKRKAGKQAGNSRHRKVKFMFYLLTRKRMNGCA